MIRGFALASNRPSSGVRVHNLSDRLYESDGEGVNLFSDHGHVYCLMMVKAMRADIFMHGLWID